MENPEDPVLAAIDRELALGEGEAMVDYCGLCGGTWHGLAYDGNDAKGALAGRQRGCPGAWATQTQIAEFKATLKARATLVPSLVPKGFVAPADGSPPWMRHLE